jgi:hypothetical protein
MRILSEAFSFQTRGQIELTSSVFDLFIVAKEMMI